jgi:hypothetical protein
MTYVNTWHPHLWVRELAEHKVAALLHEMLHAFLGIFSCACVERYRPFGLTRHGQKGSSHNSNLANAMTVLEEALTLEVNYYVDYDIPTCWSRNAAQPVAAALLPGWKMGYVLCAYWFYQKRNLILKIMSTWCLVSVLYCS